MGKRYQLISNFSSKKQFIDCPVEIEKGAILLDTVKQTCVLQLGLKNISKDNIKGGALI